MVALWGVVLLWSLLSVSHGSQVERGLLQTSPSSVGWAGQATVTGIFPRSISNDGNSRLFADFRAPACPAVSERLLLVLDSRFGGDVEIEGAMLPNCSGAFFPSGTVNPLRGVPPGSYPVRLVFGATKQSLAFAINGSGSGNDISPAEAPPTPMVTVVAAPVGRFVSQSSTTSPTSLTVTLRAALDRPSLPHVTMGLRLSDPTAADVVPPMLTWRPGEAGSKAFTLRLRRPLGPGDPTLRAEAVAVSNLVFGVAGAEPPRVSVEHALPRFRSEANQAVYRPLSDAGPGVDSGGFATSSLSGGGSDGGDGNDGVGADGTDMSSSDVDGGAAAVVQGSQLSGMGAGQQVVYVPMAVLRVSPSPFPSTLSWTADVAEATGCDGADCFRAVFGSGQVNLPPAAEAADVMVAVNWTAVPLAAILKVTLRLNPVANAAVMELPDNVTSLFVFGTVYGTCPAGTTGPWQVPAAAAAPPPPSPPPRGSGAPLPPTPSDPGGACNDGSLLEALSVEGAADPPAPILIACVGGSATVVFPPHSGPAPQAAGLNYTRDSFSAPNATSEGRSEPSSIPLSVPFGYEAAAIFVPLTDPDEVVTTLNSSCGLGPLWDKVLVASPGGSDGADSGTSTSSSNGPPTPWAQWKLPGPGPGLGAPTGPSSCSSVLSISRAASGPGPGPPAAQPQPPLQQQPPAQAPLRGLLTTNQTTQALNPNPPPTKAPTDSGLSPTPGPSPSPVPSPAPQTGTTQLRTLSLTLSLATDPPSFSNSALALALHHPPSGRYLPLCGLPLEVLLAAGAQAFGPAVFAPSNATQLAWVLGRMGRAIRAEPEALREVYLGQNALPAAGADSARRKARGTLSSGLASGEAEEWAAEAVEAGAGTAGDGAGEASVAAPAGAAVERGLAGVLAQLRGVVDGGDRGLEQRRRQVMQLGRSPPRPSRLLPVPLLAAAPPRPAPPEPAPPGGAVSDAAMRSLADALRTGAEDFDLSDAAAGGAPVRVMFNPAYVELCSVWDPQVLDLGLVPHAYDMTLVASSVRHDAGDEAVLRNLGSGAEVVVDVATRAALAALRAAARGGADRGVGVSPTVPGPYGGRPPAGPEGGPEGGNAGRSPTPGSAPAGPSASWTRDCLSSPPTWSRPEPDQRRLVALLAPDGVTTLTLTLHLFLNYTAAAAAVVDAAAAPCSPAGGNATSSSSSSSSGDSGGGARPPASRPAPAWQPPAAPPQMLAAALAAPPLSPLDACRPCSGGSFSATSNASVCLPCGPGNFSAAAFNAHCTPCPAGMFTFTRNSTSCKPCVAGSFAPRPGSTACSVCPGGTTTMSDGSSDCVAAPPPPSRVNGTRSTLVVSFGVVLNISQPGSSFAALAANNTGIDAPPDSIVKVLIAADTADALRIAPTQVHVSLMELSPSSFLVNVSATMPMAEVSDSDSGSGSGASSGGSPGREVDADTLINRLVENPDNSFPRTREATGGSLQMQYVHRQVVTLDHASSGVNVHVVVWPTLAGTAVLAVVVGLACNKYCRRRRGRLGGAAGGLPPITDALGRLCAWKSPTSPQPSYLMYGQLTSLELQDMPPPSSSVPRHRGARGSGKALGTEGPHGEGLTGSAPAADLDVITMMYTREALATPRI